MGAKLRYWDMKRRSLELKRNVIFIRHAIMVLMFACFAVPQSLQAAKFVSKSRQTEEPKLETTNPEVEKTESLSVEQDATPVDPASLDPEIADPETDPELIKSIERNTDPLEFPNSILNQRKLPPESVKSTAPASEVAPAASQQPVVDPLEFPNSLLNTAKPSRTAGSGVKLSLSEAERLALELDPLVKRAQDLQAALQDRAVAANTWPDPKVRMGVVNLSAETYDFDQEPMTQAVIGVAQAFPPAGATSAKRDKFNELSSAEGFGAEDQKLKTLMGVRKSWFNVYLQHHSRALVQQSLKQFDQLIKITRYQYRAGSGKQQDVVRAQLEQSLLEDRDKEIQEKWESALAELQKWLGSTYVHRELDMEFPQLPTIPVQRELEANLEQHPAVRVSKARVKASENEVEFANAQFRPGWMLDLSYGYRGANRDNVLSAMFIVDLPLFTGKRQGKELSASKADLSAAKNMLDDTRRVYQQKYADGLAAYQRTNERLEFYRTQLLPQAQQNTKATMNAYQSGVTGFNDVVRARLTELTSQLQFLKLQVDQAKAQADLLYLAGG